MIIRTKRLVLRPFEMEDIAWYYDLVQDSELTSTLRNLQVDTVEEAKKHLMIFSNGDCQNDFYYVIADKNKNVLGIIIAVKITRRTFDVSYFLKKEYRHNGYMHEALENLVETIREEDPFLRMRLQIEKGNVASFNVAKKFDPVIHEKEDNYMCYI